ncbi:zinc ribbon domain-containing protein [Candidatus Enterovibrio escicola]|nr:zinc ribbon domain-containing protein [Candidatus Enterovibrio escacola]
MRKWSCPECSSELDRDLNAALNIKAVGQTVLACGA